MTPLKLSMLCLSAAALTAAGITMLPLQSCTSAQAAPTVTSPDGHIAVDFGVKDGRPYYIVASNNSVVMDTSYVGIDMKEALIGHNADILEIAHESHDSTWDQPWGEERSVRNHYNQMTVKLREGDDKYFNLVFRVFDDGVGFRYEFPQQEALDSLTILDENTQFNLAEDAVAWSIPWDHEYYEHLYRKSPVSKLDTICTPLTIKVTDSLYVAIHEAALTDYASMNLTPEKGTTCLHTYLTPWSTGEKVFAAAPMTSPWRTIIVANCPGDLMLSRLMLNLNEPCAIEDTSWIEPGRYIGIWWGMHMKDYTWEAGEKHGATTGNTKRYIDFAAENGYSGVLVEGWNLGWDGDWSANGHLFSFTQPYPDFDIKEVTDYARSKGVRLIGHHETGGATINYENQMDSAFALYQRLGVNSVKTGYVNKLLDNKELHGSQYGVRHYRKVIETAAKYGIMIDNHEPVMPTGLQRTYPNLMTQEGVRGQEYDAWSPDGGNPPEHTVTIPFTRGLAGPIDFTPGTFNFKNPALPSTHPQTTLAKQLALAVVIYSPLQMSSDMIENYVGNPAFEFLTKCPVNWDKTVVPDAKIGEYAVIARKDRDSDSWYIGAISGNQCYETRLPLTFLDDNKEYVARIFADGEKADYRNNPYPVDITDVNVTSKSTLPLKLAKSGGAAIMITRK